MDLRDLAVARLLALYLVSLLTAASAALAWLPPSGFRLASLAGALALALVLGGQLAGALSAVGSAGVRRRARVFALVLVPVPSLLAVSVAWTAPAFAPVAVLALGLLQLLVLLLDEALGLKLLALWVALVLALVAAARGGLPGAVALTGFLALAGVFFALDHVTSRLATWPGVPVPTPGRVVADALRLLAAPVLLLGLALAVLPPAAPPGTLAGDGRLADLPEIRRAYEWLILLALAGTGSLALALRWLRGRQGDAPPLVETPESHLQAEEIIEPPADAEPRYGAPRDRVIRAYLRVLSAARKAGLRLERCLTPREIEGRLRRPEEPLERLTGLFMDARYGPDEPDPDAVRRADRASSVICSELHARRRTRR
jgi:hypothetical protein